MPRVALITGITGQDGSYLRELLAAEGTEVVGLVRDPSRAPEGTRTVAGDLAVQSSLQQAVRDVRPDEIFHLAAPTFVPASWEDPASAMRDIAGASATLLRAAADVGARIFVATSPEMFGDAGASPQDERTPMRPRSPYGVAKLAAHGLVGALREREGLFAVSGITYNHESARRPERFVTRKITQAAVAIAAGRQDVLELGDLGAVRDWSHARDVMRGAILALRADAPADYVFASGVGRTVRDFVEAAYDAAGIPGRVDETVRVNPEFVRPPEPWPLIGDPTRAREQLGWLPETEFADLVAEMVAVDRDA